VRVRKPVRHGCCRSDGPILSASAVADASFFLHSKRGMALTNVLVRWLFFFIMLPAAAAETVFPPPLLLLLLSVPFSFIGGGLFTEVGVAESEVLLLLPVTVRG
jgi:hypothetical protein